MLHSCATKVRIMPASNLSFRLAQTLLGKDLDTWLTQRTNLTTTELVNQFTEATGFEMDRYTIDRWRKQATERRSDSMPKRSVDGGLPDSSTIASSTPPSTAQPASSKNSA